MDISSTPGRTVDGLATARRFFAGTASTYDQCVRVWTLGRDRRWKNKILDLIPPRPGKIIDLACGTGILSLKLARRFPGSRIIGVDLHREYLVQASRKARALGLANVQWIQGRAEDVLLKGKYDCITSSYLAKYADLGPLVRNAAEMLSNKGWLLTHDFIYPRSRLKAAALRHYFSLVRGLGSRAFPSWETVFKELEPFLKQSRWVTDLISCLEQNGFKNIRIRRLTFGFAAIVTATRETVISDQLAVKYQ